MAKHDPRNEDGGYGAGNLVGSSVSGLQSAIEARQAVESVGAPARDAAQRADADAERDAEPARSDRRNAAATSATTPDRADAPRTSSIDDDPAGNSRDDARSHRG
jgi:hypothetical protein